MYGTEFWRRVNLQQVTEFLRRGSELPYHDTGTPEERYKQLKKEHYKSLCDFRDKVIAYGNWADCDEKEKEMKSEEFWEDVVSIGGSLEELSFEMGLASGLALIKDLLVQIPSNLSDDTK